MPSDLVSAVTAHGLPVTQTRGVCEAQAMKQDAARTASALMAKDSNDPDGARGVSKRARALKLPPKGLA